MKAGKMTQRAAQKRVPRRASVPDAGTEVVFDIDPGADTVVAPFPPAAASPAAASTGAGLTLAADCTARNATELKATLLAGLEQAAPLRIDVAQVERVDTVCLQLLVALVRDRERTGRSVHWDGFSEPLAQAAGLLGLAATLGLGVQG